MTAVTGGTCRVVQGRDEPCLMNPERVLQATLLVLLLLQGPGCRSNPEGSEPGSGEAGSGKQISSASFQWRVGGVNVGMGLSGVKALLGEPAEIEREYEFQPLPIYHAQVESLLSYLEKPGVVVEPPDGLEKVRRFHQLKEKRLRESGETEKYYPMAGGGGANSANFDPTVSPAFHEATADLVLGSDIDIRVYVDARSAEEIRESTNWNEVADKMERGGIALFFSAEPDGVLVGHLFKNRYSDMLQYPEQGVRILVEPDEEIIKRIEGSSLEITGPTDATFEIGASKTELLADQSPLTVDEFKIKSLENGGEYISKELVMVELRVNLQDGLATEYVLRSTRKYSY